MTIEELKEFASSEDGKEIMAAFLSESGYKSADDIAGLESKKNELLGKLKRANDNKSAIDSVFKEYDIIDSEDLAAKLATLASARENESDLEKMQRRLEIIEKAAAEDKKRAEQATAQRVNAEKKAQIMSALKNAHVNDESIDILMPYFDGKVKAEDADGNIKLIVDSDEGPSPFSDFVESWSKTDKAKQFIKAPANSGGGANGPGNGGSPNQMTMEQIEALPTREARLKAMAELGAKV